MSEQQGAGGTTAGQQQGAAGGAGAAGAGTGAGASGAEAVVPSGRLREESAARQAAEAKVAAMAAQEKAWMREREVMRAGITDPEGVDLALFLYDRLPEASRPATPGAWLSGLTAETAPKPLALYHSRFAAAAGAGAGGASGAGADTGAAAKTTVPANGKTTSAPTNGTGAAQGSGGFDAAAIRALREEAQRTGDYSKLRAAMPGITASAAKSRAV